EGTQIGSNIRIDDNTVIGKQPMRSVNSIFEDKDKKDPAIIGDGSLIGTGVVIYAGSKIGDEVLMADLSTIREDSSVGDKTIVGRNVTIENLCEVGANCKIQTNAYITAYSEVGDYVFIAPGVITTNDNFAGRSEERFKYHKGIIVKDGGRIGANATTLSGITINEDTLVAAGSVVTQDTPPKKIVMGSPAKEHKDVPEDQLLENQ
ncbi:MAG: DapH/DapD/GlmU-related protein, partial [Halanaerobiales bacterium]